MISEKNPEKAKQLIKKETKHPIIVEARSNEFNRKLLEYGKFDILLSPEKQKDRDKLRYLESGINSIMAKIATKNKVAIGIDLKEISKLDKKEKAIRLSRMKQNIKVLRKAKTKLKIINYKDKKDAFSLLISLGASTEQAREAF